MKAEEGAPEAAVGAEKAVSGAAPGPSAKAEAQPSPPETALEPAADSDIDVDIVTVEDVAADVAGDSQQHAAAGASEAIAAPEDSPAAGTAPMDVGEPGGVFASGEPTPALENPAAEM